MLLNEALALVRAKVLTQFLVRHGVTPLAIKALPQPMQAGPSSTPTAYLYVVGNRPVGSPRVNTLPTGDREQIDSLEMTIQVSMRSPGSTNPAALTSQDYAVMLHSIMQGPDFIKAIQPHATILRITDIRTTTFKDDSDQYSNVPSFDIVLKHQNVYEGGVLLASRIDGVTMPNGGRGGIWTVPDII